MFYGLYRYLTRVGAPLVKRHLKRRLAQGKEDPARISERFGGASFSRPDGDLVWFHAASVGESVAILPLIHKLVENYPVLVTTGTLTSARLMVNRLPKGCYHQFIPLDVPQWVERFLDHWQPRVGVFVESELWPNLVFLSKKRHIPLLLINAHMSNKSYQFWRWAKPMIRRILRSFKVIFAQDEITASRYNKLGGVDVRIAGNLKFAADPVPYDYKTLSYLRDQVGSRPIWAAVSTHQGEEGQIVQVAQGLKEKFPNLLTLIVPRHPERAMQIQQLLTAPTILRTSGKPISAKHDYVIWDTIGELGLVFRLSPICFIGGSLVPVGGHNPIEPLLHGVCPIMGPYFKNFQSVVEKLHEGIVLIQDGGQLKDVVEKFLTHSKGIDDYVAAGQQVIQDQQDSLDMIYSTIEFLAKRHG